ncbi:hypothetical protein ACO0SA_001154 [Hanseniaspora valbyensis]
MTEFNVKKLLSQLTVDEKISLLAAVDYWHTTPIERLDIPSLRVSDGPNGVRGTKEISWEASKAACFPNGTALASTFDTDLLFKAGALMALEAKHKSAQIILGPTTNIQRGPLGGRGFESYSEDPYLSGIASSSVVNGIQKNGVGATIKHFCCNDMEDDRFAYDVQVSQRALREIYLEPFRLAVKYSDPLLFMTAYNSVNGQHASANKHLLDEILIKEWKSKAVVISDWYGSSHIVEGIKNGEDIEFPGPARFRTKELVKHLLFSKAEASDGTVFTEHDIDVRVEKILNLVKYFVDVNGSTKFSRTEDDKNNTPETSAFLRHLAAESIVLLKNENNVLPLKTTDDIVVIGPNAKASNASGGGSASMASYYIVTPYEGISNAVGRKDVPYVKGCDNHKALSNLFEQCTNTLKPDVKGVSFKAYIGEQLGADGEEPFIQEVVEKSFTRKFDFDNDKLDKDKKFHALFEGEFIPEESGEYDFGCLVWGTALLYVGDKLAVNQRDNQEKGSAFFSSGTTERIGKINLEGGKPYSIKVVYASAAFSTVSSMIGYGGIQVGVNKAIDVTSEIERSAKIASQHDKVILVVGLTSEIESEGYDRADMALPNATNELIRAVLKANPNTVVVNQSGCPVEMPWIQDASAVVQAYYGGNELGNAIADVVFGKVNPSGKLTVTWPIRNEDNPAFFNFESHMGRVIYGEDIWVGYKYYEKKQQKVLFPFGYGLSYTTFDVSGLKINVSEEDDSISVSATVKNTGSVDGKEVVQVYVGRTSKSVVPRVVKELKGFTKVALKAGESKEVNVHISLKDSTSYFNEYRDQWHLEAGDYAVYVGTSSDETNLTETFTVETEKYWSGL